MRHLLLTRDLRIEPAGPGEFRVLGSGLASAEGVVDGGTLDLLSCFASPRTPADARGAVDQLLALDDEAYDGLIARFESMGWLVDADAPGASSDRGDGGFASLRVQHAMVRDAARVDAYRVALLEHARGRTVLDLGAGTGLLSMLAARAGARRVYAIEGSSTADLAAELFARNGLEDRVTLIRGLSTEVDLPERCDLVVHEIFDTDPLAEDVLRYTLDARRLVTDDALWLPRTLSICVTGLELPDRVDTTTLAHEAKEAGARLGLDLDPLADALIVGAARRRRIVRAMPAGARALTDEQVVWRLTLGEDDVDAAGPVTVSLPVRARGVIGAFAISFRAEFPGGTALSTGVYAAPTSWGWLLEEASAERGVRPGDAVDARATVEVGLGGPRCRVDLA
ncbi:MAG: 50S ribosomal protein L11 methyltransferase [Sandaracinaceae bacterium]|nr:50S ribosomal protein L11 methyltransferase [Sandaracinaceae bacterium]